MIATALCSGQEAHLLFNRTQDMSLEPFIRSRREVLRLHREGLPFAREDLGMGQLGAQVGEIERCRHQQQAKIWPE